MDLTPKALQSLGAELGEKYWDSGAKFWASYYKSMQLRNYSVTDSPIRIDPSSVIVEAIDRLKSDPELLESYRSRYSLILIDEFHESDQSQRELLTLISGGEVQLYLDPDSAIGRFRGADPDGVATWLKEFVDSSLHLPTTYRSTHAITELGLEIASRFRSHNPARKRAAAPSNR